MALTVPVRDLLLPDPELGGRALHHDAGFERLDGTFDDIRDTINFGIRQLNHLPGCHLPTLTEESLEQLLIQPLTGDYPRIRQSADACRIAARALQGWAHDVGLLSVRVAPVWAGQAAAAYVAQTATYAVVADTAGVLVGRGSLVFEELADFSEWIAVEAERLVDRLARALRRLIERVLTRLNGPVGVAATVVDALQHGTDVVTDLIDDVLEVIDLIEQGRDLVTRARSTVGRIHDELHHLTQLRALLPTAAELPLP
jgi:hypothetical protein